MIGFSESFLGTLHIGATPAAIRICGTITILALTIVTLISTALAIKTQYLILTLIGLSLLSVFLGHPAAAAAAAAPHLKPADERRVGGGRVRRVLPGGHRISPPASTCRGTCSNPEGVDPEGHDAGDRRRA